LFGRSTVDADGSGELTSAMKILTFNAWHGLNGKGTLRHGELEEPQRRARRLERQVHMLRALAPDIAFIQETNPLAVRLPALKRDLAMNGVGQSDLCGIKFWGKGIPSNLNSGLSILARESITKRLGLRLSGSKWSFARPYFSLQVSETRYGLLAEVATREFGRLLVINAHLHHGFEPAPALVQKLRQLVEQQHISEAQYAQVMSEMEHAGARRLGEGQRLLDAVAAISPGYDGIILAGDLNADPQAKVVDLIKKAGFAAIVPDEMRTWDRTRNTYNFALAEGFTLPVSDFGIPALHKLMHDHDKRLTRLDHIFVSHNISNRVGAVSLFGDDLPPEEMVSDHFGIVAELH
jgi:endonuclease/exonuclease/phosphatase family metal-dependent hydrolase